MSALFFGIDFDREKSLLRMKVLEKISSANFTALLIFSFRDPLFDEDIIFTIEGDIIFGIELFEELLRFESVGFFHGR